jgi:glycosyltransferase involved in cell wall biosynthesis
MIKVLYALNGVFNKGGTESVVLNYFNYIDREKFHIDFLVHGYEKDNLNNEAHNYIMSKGSKIFYVTPRGKNYFKNKKEIKKILTENQYDIVHSHMDAAGAFFLKEAKSAGVKVRVAHSHNTNHQINKGNKILDFVYRRILNRAIKGVRRYANRCIACSGEAGQWLFGEESYIVLKNAIDVDKYAFNEQIRLEQRRMYNIDNKFVIGHVGRFSEQKNHKLIIEIFNELQKINNNAVLMLVGSGELEAVTREKVASLGLEEKVLFMGNCSNVNVLMQAMDLFILPSLFEGLPVAAIEAQAAGLPCIISDTISKDVKITDNVYFKSINESPEEWARCIRNTPHLRANTREDIISSGYDINSLIKRLEGLYQEGLSKNI